MEAQLCKGICVTRGPRRESEEHPCQRNTQPENVSQKEIEEDGPEWGGETQVPEASRSQGKRVSRRRQGSRVLDAPRRAGAGSVGFSSREVPEVSH